MVDTRGMEPGLIARTPGTRWRRTLRGVVLHAPGAAEPVLVEAPGDVVWEALAQPVALDVLVGEIARAFHADPAVVGADVDRLVGELVALGAARRVTSA